MTTVFEVIDAALPEYYCNNKEYEKGLAAYRTLILNSEGDKKQKAINDFTKYAFEYGALLASDNKWGEAISLYREIMTFPDFPVTTYKNVGLCLKAMKKPDDALLLMEMFRERVPDNPEIYEYMGSIIYTDQKDLKKAIDYYEKSLALGGATYHVYSMLGHLYSTYYRDAYKEKQIDYLKKAYDLNPKDRIAIKNLAYVLGKFDMTEEADKYYAELFKAEPQHSDLHSYGAYLVRHKRFKEGFTYLRHRFQKEDLKGKHFPDIFFSEYGWTPDKDVSNKDVVVYYEQGFGDTIMFLRFVPQLKKICKSVSVIVPPSLLDLFKDSNLGLDFYIPQQIDSLKFDYVIPMMDLPLVCNMTTVEDIPLAEGYLSVHKKKIEAYRKVNIKDNEVFKIGIAYEGTLSSKETQRDIELSKLYPLMQLPNVMVYSFQVDDLTKQMDLVPSDYNFCRLGTTFKNWEDTACAMKCMDLMVTTDNGVMNLAGALGVKTFGLFNSITEWRWFNTTGEDIAWYKSIKPFQCPTDGAWDVVVNQVVKEVQRLAKEKK